MWNALVFAFGLTLLVLMAGLGVVAVELVSYEIECARPVEFPTVHPKVKKLMRKHGVIHFDWNEKKREFGYWHNGKWCPAR